MNGSVSLNGKLVAGQDAWIFNGLGDFTLEHALTAGRDVSIETQGRFLLAGTGGIGAGRDVSLNGASLSLLGSLKTGGDATLTALTGNLDLEGLLDPGHSLTAQAFGDITLAGTLNAAGDIGLFSREGGIGAKGLSAGGGVSARAKSGVTVDGEVVAGGDAAFHAETGDVALLASLNAGGNVDLGALNGNVGVAGALNAGNDVSAQAFGDILLGEVRSQAGSINAIAGGDIDAYSLVAARDILARTPNGSVAVLRAEGGNLVFDLGAPGSRLTVGDAAIGQSLHANAGRIEMERITHAGTAAPLQIALAGPAGQGPMTDVTIRNIDSVPGVKLDGLWTETAFIHVDSAYFRLDNVYAIDHADLSNSYRTLTLFGPQAASGGSRTNAYDSQINAYFTPDANHPFTWIEFNGYRVTPYGLPPEDVLEGAMQGKRKRVWDYIFETMNGAPAGWDDLRRLVFREPDGEEFLIPGLAGEKDLFFLRHPDGRLGIFHTSALQGGLPPGWADEEDERGR
jgi:hypothetical protein